MEFKCKINPLVENTNDCAGCWIEKHKGIELIKRPASRVICKAENEDKGTIQTDV